MICIITGEYSVSHLINGLFASASMIWIASLVYSNACAAAVANAWIDSPNAASAAAAFSALMTSPSGLITYRMLSVIVVVLLKEVYHLPEM